MDVTSEIWITKTKKKKKDQLILWLHSVNSVTVNPIPSLKDTAHSNLTIQQGNTTTKNMNINK